MAYKRIALDVMGREDEVTAGAAVLPGKAVQLQADGKWDPVVSTAAEYAKGGLCIAVEDGLQGKRIDEAYADGDPMKVIFPQTGDEVLLLVKDGETIAIGDDLIVETTSGLFVEAAGSEAAYEAQALEAVSPSGANGFCRCLIY